MAKSGMCQGSRALATSAWTKHRNQEDTIIVRTLFPRTVGFEQLDDFARFGIVKRRLSKAISHHDLCSGVQ